MLSLFLSELSDGRIFCMITDQQQADDVRLKDSSFLQRVGSLEAFQVFHNELHPPSYPQVNSVLLETLKFIKCVIIVITDLKNEPYRRADAVRRSQRRRAEAEIKLNAYERF